MNDYISRDDALLHSEIIRVYSKDYGNIDVVPVEYLADIPSADVQPVYHGEWKYYKNNGIFDIYKCSVCGTPFNLPMDVVPSSVFCYCPHCGKKMIDNTVSQNRCSNYMDCDGSCFIDDTPCDCAGNIEKCKGRCER